MITKFLSKTGHLMPAFWDGKEHRLLARTPSMSGDRLRAARMIRPFSQYLEATANPVVDLNTLDPYDRYQSAVPILDQGQVGSCVGHAHAAAMMKARDLGGQQFVALSADSLYAQIDGDQDQGSDPADAIQALITTGICTLADVPDQFVLWKNISDQAKQTAARFRIDKASVYQCANFAEMVTADMLGFAVTLTINVGDNFGPDSNGVVGFTAGYANHNTSGGEAFKRINGVPSYRGRNSWNGWGDNGCYWMQAQHIDGQPGLELYAIKWASDDPEDPNPIPGL